MNVVNKDQELRSIWVEPREIMPLAPVDEGFFFCLRCYSGATHLQRDSCRACVAPYGRTVKLEEL